MKNMEMENIGGHFKELVLKRISRKLVFKRVSEKKALVKRLKLLTTISATVVVLSSINYSLFASEENAYGNSHNSSSKKWATVKPLLGSEWAQKNPGILPFSKCSLVQLDYDLSEIPLTDRGTWDTPDIFYKSFGLLLGGSTLFTSGVDSEVKTRYGVSCVSFKYGLSFILPIKLASIMTFPQIGSSDEIMHVHFDKESLTGKKVSSLFKTFDGIDVSLSVLVGAGVTKYVNEDGIMISLWGAPVGINVKFGYSRLSLSKLRNEKLPSYVTSLTANPQKAVYFIINGTAGNKVTLPNNTPIVSMVADNKLAIKMAEREFYYSVEEVVTTINEKNEKKDMKVIIRKKLYIPAGALAVWNGGVFTFTGKYKSEAGDQLITQNFREVEAIDGSIAVGGSVLNDGIIAKKQGSLIIHRPSGSVVWRKSNEKIDFDSISNLKFIWDGVSGESLEKTTGPHLSTGDSYTQQRGNSSNQSAVVLSDDEQEGYAMVGEDASNEQYDFRPLSSKFELSDAKEAKKLH